MELEHKLVHDMDLQTSSMAQIQTEICNTVEGTVRKKEPGVHPNDDLVVFTENTNHSGDGGIRVGVKTEVSDTDGCGNMNIIHTSAHVDVNTCDNSNYFSKDRIYDTNVPIKSEPRDECLETPDDTAFLIEIDTCKDEYYEMHGYPTSHVASSLNELQPGDVPMLSAIDIKACTVPLTGIKCTYTDIITQRSVQVHGSGQTSGIDERCNINRRIHSNNIKKAHACSVCGVAFPSKSDLNSHTLIHTGVKPYKCSVCGVAFARKDHLKTHMRIHTGEKAHKCSVCEVSFSQKGNLASHMRIHTGEKPYKCTVCGAEFTHKHHMTTHTGIHTGKKPHKCSVCQVSFARKWHLTRHMWTHTGEKPYTCTVCGVCFAQSSHLNYHITTHTNVT